MDVVRYSKRLSQLSLQSVLCGEAVLVCSLYYTRLLSFSTVLGYGSQTHDQKGNRGCQWYCSGGGRLRTLPSCDVYARHCRQLPSAGGRVEAGSGDELLSAESCLVAGRKHDEGKGD